MIHLIFEVNSIREYPRGADEVPTLNVKVTQRLMDTDTTDETELDSTIYTMDEFLRVHTILKLATGPGFNYHYGEFTQFLKRTLS